jgi:hypothetical protein
MIEVVMALGCPRCAAGVAARRAFWEGAPLEQLAVALVPFVVVALASWAAARIGARSSTP